MNSTKNNLGLIEHMLKFQEIKNNNLKNLRKVYGLRQHIINKKNILIHIYISLIIIKILNSI